MRVLRIVALASRTGAYGGPFDTATAQCELVRKIGHDVRMLAGAFAGDAPSGHSILSTFPVRHTVGQRSFVDVAGFRMFPSLWRGIIGSDLVHISMAREPVPIVAAIIAVITRTPAVLQPHGMLTTTRRGRAHRALDALLLRRLMARAANIIALTDTERGELEDWSEALVGRIVIIGNPPPRGLPVEGTTRQEEDDAFADALFAARLHPRKRVLDFAKAAAEANSHGWSEQYVVLGPDEGDLEALTKIAGDTSSLRYGGVTDNLGVLERLKRSKVFVLASQNEPWGNVLVAALTYGKPVVVTRSSALAKLVETYGAGLVVADGDPKAIAEAVHKILSKTHYVDFSNQSYKLAVENFSAHGVTEALQKTYSHSI